MAIRPSAEFHASCARWRVVSNDVPAGFSAVRLALALAVLTNEMPTRTLTVRPALVSKLTNAPEPRPAGGKPLVPYVVPPLDVVEPWVTVPSRQVPVTLNGLSDTATNRRVYEL